MKPNFIHFNDLKKTTIDWDFHIHTLQTDGSSSIEEYIKCAQKRDIKKIAFTEHVRKTSSWYNSFVRNVEDLRKKYSPPLTIYHGIETKILNDDGDLDATDEMIQNAEIILGSVHRFPEKKENKSEIRQFIPEEFAEYEYYLAIAILKNHDVDVLAHPGGMYIQYYKADFPEIYLKQLIKTANKYEKAIEINSYYLRNSRFNINLFSKFNPKISLGSDAHNKKELGTVIQFITEKIERM